MTQPPAPWNETRDRDDDTQTRDVAKNEAASVASDAKEQCAAGGLDGHGPGQAGRR